MNTLIATGKIIAIMAFILLIIVIQTPILWFTRGPKSYFFTRFYHIATCKALGLSFEIIGKPTYAQQTLYVCNHMSYLDITAIGRVIHRASFIAKKEARSMPIYGYLSTMQQTAFISRDRKDALKERNALDTMVLEGKSLILFPEGTSTDGREVLPFKSSLFGIVLKDEVKEKMRVQPLTLSLMSVDGKSPHDQDIREIYAWSRDMTIPMTSHLWRLCKTRGARLRIEFHDPIAPKDYKDRKALAQAAHAQCAGALNLPQNAADTENVNSALDSKHKAA